MWSRCSNGMLKYPNGLLPNGALPMVKLMVLLLLCDSSLAGILAAMLLICRFHALEGAGTAYHAEAPGGGAAGSPGNPVLQSEGCHGVSQGLVRGRPVFSVKGTQETATDPHAKALEDVEAQSGVQGKSR
jgi:hypothetical protein